MRVGFQCSRSRPQSGSVVKSCLFKPAEVDFIKHHKKVNHNWKVHHTQYLCAQIQGQGHSLMSEVKIRRSSYSEKYNSKLH